MALYDKNGWYNNVFGDGVNIFGAGLDSNSKILREGGLLKPTDIEQAQRKSLTQGLLGTVLSYFAQPKNQGYGSGLPYIAKALQTGIDQAGKPFENLTQDAMLRQKMEEYNRQKELREAKDRFNKGFGVNNDVRTVHDVEVTQGKDMSRGGNVVGPDGQLTYMPSHLGGTQKLQTAEVAPQELSKTTAVDNSRTEEYFNTQKYLEDSLQKGDIQLDDYIKYSNALKSSPDEYITVGDRLYNKTTEEWIDIPGSNSLLDNLSPGQKKLDETFAVRMADDEDTRVNVLRNVTDLKWAVKELRTQPEGTISGKGIGYKDAFGAWVFTNTKARDVRNAVERVLQLSLKKILGGNFTEAEGKMMLARTYDPLLTQEQNAQNVQNLMETIAHGQRAYEHKKAWFIKHKTLAGYQGPTDADIRVSLGLSPTIQKENGGDSDDDWGEITIKG